MIRIGMRDSACCWLIVENAKIFLCKEVFMNHPIMFLDRDNKGKLVPGSFSYYIERL